MTIAQLDDENWFLQCAMCDAVDYDGFSASAFRTSLKHHGLAIVKDSPGEKLGVQLARSLLDEAWAAVHALGGTVDRGDIGGFGYARAILDALKELEQLGAMDPVLRNTTVKVRT